MVESKIIFNVPGIIKVSKNEICGKFLISTNTRNCTSDDVFVALKGPSFDGFNFIKNAIEKKCSIIVYNHESKTVKVVENFIKQNPEVCFIGVENTEKYLQLIAKSHAQSLRKNGKLKFVIGITGSNGKTTTKNMLFHILSESLGDLVGGNIGSFNNHIGVPLTLLGLDEKKEVVIVEMGSNHPGEIKFLCDIAGPNAGIITNIGDAHLEFFRDKDGIFLEKRTLFDEVMDNTENDGFFVTNADDDYLKILPKKNNHLKSSVDNGDIKIDISRNTAVLKTENDCFELRNENITGHHNFLNLSLSFLMAQMLYPSKMDTTLAAASTFKPTSNRSQWVDKWKKKIFLDAYNANPSSMIASVEAFLARSESEGVNIGECLLILGDMNELGDESRKLHIELGKTLKKKGVKNPIFVGKHSCDYEFGYQLECKIFQSTEKLVKNWKKIISRYKYILIKGSRTLQLELLLDIN